jgi:hypothetical protein
LRYRFNDGIAARGRFVGKTLPIIDGVASKHSKELQPICSAIGMGKRNDPFRASGYETPTQVTVEANKPVKEDRQTEELVNPNQEQNFVHWGLDHVDSKSRFCLGYCKCSAGSIFPRSNKPQSQTT